MCFSDNLLVDFFFLPAFVKRLPKMFSQKNEKLYFYVFI